MGLYENFIRDLMIAAPLVTWAVAGLLLLVVNLFCTSRILALVLSLLGVAAVGFAESASPNGLIKIFSGLAVRNGWGGVLSGLSVVVFAGVFLMLVPGLNNNTKLYQKSYPQLPELLMCLLFSGFGLNCLIISTDLTSIFMGLETFSIGLYCACGFFRTEMRSTESGFKYLMIGAFSTVLLLFGISFLYGATGETNLELIQMTIVQGLSNDRFVLLQIACLFLVAAFGFKLSLVPFHFYTPEVYEGAPTPITALLTTAVKIGALGAAVRLFGEALGSVEYFWKPYWILICLLSVIVGNIMAIQQKSLKKLFAFSSISHSGFMALALLNISDGRTAIANYLIVYAIMNLGFFALLTYMEKRAEVTRVEDLKGLSEKRLALSLALGLFILGLAGFPPFAGFIIKFWVLEALLKADLVWVALIAVMGSLIGAVYYLRLLMTIFMSEEEGRVASWTGEDKGFLLRTIIVIGLLITVFGGLKPQLYAEWVLTAFAFR